MLAKPFDEITADDIHDLCKRGAYENQLLEFKRELSAERKRPDPWPTGGDLTGHAQERLFREITAFANAHGGTLILGIEETKDKPPRAAKISPLPRIADLAVRIEDSARARIEPVIPGLQIRGIATASSGNGVLILRTPASVFGPHRVVSHGHAFIRRGASSVQMTMREIQDLTLDLARGADRLDAIFRQRATAFFEWLQRTNDTYAACRITALPLGSFPGLPRLSRDPNEVPIRTQFEGNIGSLKVTLRGPALGGFRPIVRGIRRHDHDSQNVRIEVYETGLVDLWYRHQEVQGGYHFFIGPILGAYLSVLDTIDTMRMMASVPDWEFAIEFALDGLTVTPRAGGGRVPLGDLALGGFNDTNSSVRISELPVSFPRIPYRSRDAREAVINIVLNDLMDAAGEPRNAPPLKLAVWS
jgi:hypothetical protein